MTEQITPSSLRAQRQTTTTIELPYSGLVAEVGHVQLDRLLIDGQIPDLLSGIVSDVLWSSVGQGRKEEEIRTDKRFYELVNSVVSAALVYPRIAEAPSVDDELAIDDLPFGDRILLYSVCTQPLAVLHRFRQIKAPTVDALPEGETVLDAAEPDPPAD